MMADPSTALREPGHFRDADGGLVGRTGCVDGVFFPFYLWDCIFHPVFHRYIFAKICDSLVGWTIDAAACNDFFYSMGRPAGNS